MFIERFFPDYYYKNVESIPYEILEKENIKAIIFDMDNTLVDNKYKYSNNLKIWIENMRSKGIKFCILSNTPRKKKASEISMLLNIKYIINASKPRFKGFKKAFEYLNVDRKNIAIIGDQLFTDIWGGNRVKIKTILVEPIAKKEIIFTRIKRPLERFIIKRYNKIINSKEKK